MKKIWIIITVVVIGCATCVLKRYLDIPKVSVVMLTYQRASYLTQSMDSILTQTYPDFEFIILNDGSTDNTDAVVAKYHDKRIRYYKNPKNMGISYSRNRAADLARGKYIMIMDDDDVSLPVRMEKQVQYLDEHPDVAAVTGQIVGFYRIINNHDTLAYGLLNYNSFGNGNVMYRRNFARKHNIQYDEKLSAWEDRKFWIDFWFAGAKFGAIDEDILVCRTKNAKYYSGDGVKLHQMINTYIGNLIEPEKPEIYLNADECQKIKLLETQNILSENFINNKKNEYCSTQTTKR